MPVFAAAAFKRGASSTEFVWLVASLGHYAAYVSLSALVLAAAAVQRRLHRRRSPDASVAGIRNVNEAEGRWLLWLSAAYA